MGKICDRGLNYFQVSDDRGKVRICTWTFDCNIGNLVDQTFEEVWYGKRACQMRDRLIAQDYSKCVWGDCPYLSKNQIDKYMVEIDNIPDYPEQLSLSYDNVCNYNCSTCDIHERYVAADKKEMSKRFDKIEAELRKILPYIKEISANGQGEVFASKRTMKMLSEWKPIAPPSECRASIETNGSLFDEEHWKLIENLGQYYLMVSVTVMSFDEYTYQQLSGVKYPISRIENNLRYIKSLREKGIINFLELATVVQERNFRQLPEFTRRCIEEFGADEVRLRYFLPWHKKSPDVEWFADVRNPYHPYYTEFREIMKDPIFQNPKVNDWSGGKDSQLGPHPFLKYKKDLYKEKIKLKTLDLYIHDRSGFKQRLENGLNKEEGCVVYGLGEVGKIVIDQLIEDDINVYFIMDRKIDLSEYKGIQVRCPDCDNITLDNYQVIITPIGDNKNIEDYIQRFGMPKNVIKIDEVFCEGE